MKLNEELKMFTQKNCIISDFEEIKKKSNYSDKEMEALLKWYHSEKSIKVRGNKLFIEKELVYEYVTR